MQYSFAFNFLWLFILFVYNTNHYNVLEETQNSFDSSDDKDFIMTVTEGEDSNFKLVDRGKNLLLHKYSIESIAFKVWIL